MKPTVLRRLCALMLGAFLGAALLRPGTMTDRAWGQDVPKLPKTKVEADPTPGQPSTAPEQPSPNPNDFPPPPDPGAGAGAPIGAGGPFASPAADGYNAPSTTIGTILNVPSINFPGITSTVTSAAIADQQILTVDDMLRDIPSAVKSIDNGFRPDAFLLRGFEIRARDYRWNGYQDFSPAPRDFANVQRVEILQGPGSVLYGSGQPSGVVNFITKKPLDDTCGAVDVQGGSYGFFRTTADVNGAGDFDPLGTGGYLAARVNLAYQNTETFRDFSHIERTLLNPVLTYVIDDCTAITYEFQYLIDRRLFDTGVAAVGGQPTTNPVLLAAGVGFVNGLPSLLPKQRFLGEPTDFQDFTDYKNSLTFVHKFNDDWAMKVGGFVGWHDSPQFSTQPILFGNDPSLAPFAQAGLVFPPTTILRQANDFYDFKEQNYDFVANLAGKFDTGCIKHTAVVGYEFNYFNSDDAILVSDPITTVASPFGPFPIGASSPINFLNPNYNVPTPPLNGPILAAVTQARNGFYAQDLMELTPQLKFLAGVRYDIVYESFFESVNTTFAGFPVGVPPTSIPEHSYYWSPRVGLIYQPIENMLSFYGSYSESFDPAATGIFPAGFSLKPETGRDGEGGVKMELLDKKLSIIAAGFYIVKDNVVTQTSEIFSTQIGTQRSQGAEVGAVGRLTDYLSIIANYSYVDSRILNSEVQAEVGQRFRNSPFNNGNVWARYNVIQDRCRTLGAALGAVYVGSRPGDLFDSFTLPAYLRWDAGLYYQQDQLRASLYLENLFSERYYTGALNNLSVFPGAPFTLRATVSYNF
jgi:iron complex outermembrane recepter protein